MKYRLLLVVLVVLVLAGCSTTPQRLRAGSPHSVHSSNKDSKVIAMCIADAWENTRVIGSSPTVNWRETPAGYTVSMQMGGKLHYLADVENREQVSMTKLYLWQMILSLGPNPSVTSVAECQL